MALGRIGRRLWPDTLFGRFFRLQLLTLVLVMGAFWALFAVDQARSSMVNVAEAWAPALRMAGERDDGQGNDRTKRGAALTAAAPPVSIVRGVPPADAYAPHWTHLRWRALENALRERGVPVDDLVVSGRTGQAVVWLGLRARSARGERSAGAVVRNAGDTPSVEEPPARAPSLRWIGVRSNLEGADFPTRWATAMAMAMAIVAVVAWRFSRRVAAPLRRLEDDVHAFASGRPPGPPFAPAPEEVRSLAIAFARMARERTDLDAQRALMLAGISHDIRSPLGRIRMAAELLDQPCEVAASRERIVRNVGIADGLVESFSDYVRAEAESMDERVDMAELASRLARAASIDCDLIGPNEGTAWVRGNRRLLERAIDNLIDNAKRHGAPPIVIAVEVDVVTAINTGDAMTRRVRVTVTDHGAGIAPADRERLTRPFERGDASRGIPGSGLGLAIARRVAERHGGRLEIAGGNGAGATAVLLRLPTHAIER